MAQILGPNFHFSKFRFHRLIFLGWLLLPGEIFAEHHSDHSFEAKESATKPLFPDSEKQRAQKLVLNAVEFYKQNGSEATFKEIHRIRGKLRDGFIYVFVYRTDGTMLANGQFPGGVGKNYLEAKDRDGRKFIKERVELVRNRKEAWQLYKYFDPEEKLFKPKLSYLKKVDDRLIFGAGVYGD